MGDSNIYPSYFADKGVDNRNYYNSLKFLSELKENSKLAILQLRAIKHTMRIWDEYLKERYTTQGKLSMSLQGMILLLHFIITMTNELSF